MGDAKSQFVLGGYTGANYLFDSLNLMGKQTNTGIDPATETLITSMTGYATANPDKTNVAQLKGYVGKLTAAAEPESKPSVGMRGSKPNNGIM